MSACNPGPAQRLHVCTRVSTMIGLVRFMLSQRENICSEVSACALQAVHPAGSCIVTGGRRGVLHQWSLPAHGPASEGAAPAVSTHCSGSGTAHPDSSRTNGTGSAEGRTEGQALPDLRHWCQPLHMEGSGHSDTIDRTVALEHSTLLRTMLHGHPLLRRMP